MDFFLISLNVESSNDEGNLKKKQILMSQMLAPVKVFNLG